MKRFFPIMNDEPERGMHFALLAYWFIGFELVPTFITLISDGYWDNLSIISWFEIAYHVLNGVVILIMLKSYLADSFLNVQLDPKRFFKIVGLSALVMLILAAGILYFIGPMALDFYPLPERIVAITSGYLVDQQPIFGTLCYSIFTPFAVVGLFYVSVFAPVCRHNGWLGYIVVTLFLAVPYALEILWRGQAEYMVLTFLSHLPMHWIACWTYQKADTVWAPLATLSIFNMVMSVLSAALI